MNIEKLEYDAERSSKNQRYQLQIIAKKILTDPAFFSPEKRIKYYEALKEHTLLKSRASFDETVTREELNNFYKNFSHRICTCGRIPVNGGSIDDAQYVSLKKNSKTKDVHTSGMQHCSNVWVCPVCTAKITQRRIKEITQGIENWQALGATRGKEYTQIMVTYTIPHYFNQNLDYLRNILMTAKRKLKQQKRLKRRPAFVPYKELKERFKISGTLSAVEITYGYNGWHPHTHDLYFVRGKLTTSEIVELQNLLAVAWIKVCILAGIEISDTQKNMMVVRSVDVRQAKTAVDYIAKWGIEGLENAVAEYEAHKDVLGSGWGSAQELTLSHMKNSIKDGFKKNGKGYSPWDLLRAIQQNPGDRKMYLKFGRLFLEYACAFKGKRQLFWSKDFKTFLNIHELTDKQVMENDEITDDDYGEIPKVLWIWILKNELIGKILYLGQTLSFNDLVDWIETKRFKQIKKGELNGKKQTIKGIGIEFA